MSGNAGREKFSKRLYQKHARWPAKHHGSLATTAFLDTYFISAGYPGRFPQVVDPRGATQAINGLSAGRIQK
jgi:hypothetical protein